MIKKFKKMHVGNKIKGFRIEKGLTAIDMAERLGISEPTYRRYEANKTSPDLVMLTKIAEQLDKNFLDFLPTESLVGNSLYQKGGVVVNLGTINSLSEKLIEQYEARLKDKDQLINLLKEQKK